MKSMHDNCKPQGKARYKTVLQYKIDVAVFDMKRNNRFDLVLNDQFNAKNSNPAER